MVLESNKSLKEMSTGHFSWGVKAAGEYGSQSSPTRGYCLQTWEHQALGTLGACNRSVQGLLYLYLLTPLYYFTAFI